MLDPGEYLEKIDSLQKEYKGRKTAGSADRVDQDELNCIEFASASLRHLLPNIPIEKHVGFINEVLLNQVCADLDEDSCFLTQNTILSDPKSMLEAARGKPVIFCTFHFGSYRLINQVLASRGLNYILPVAGDIYASHKKRYEDNFEGIKSYFKSASQLLVVNAEEPIAALTMTRKTHAGWSLLAYIDGNTGVQGATRRDAKLIKVSLLGKPIYARKGIAFLSHFLKLPIVPVICEITGPMERRMTFHEKIDPSMISENRESYCQIATQKLYSLLGEYLKKKPAQWEGWMFLQKYLDIEGLTEPDNEDRQGFNERPTIDEITGNTLVFNRNRFGFIVQENQRVLLDKATYKLLSLPDNVSAILDSYREPVPVSYPCITDEQRDMIGQLVSMDMLSVVE
jgi:predicted LPLAT superfamily acyltransferase